MNGRPFILLDFCWCCVAVFRHSLRAPPSKKWRFLLAPMMMGGGGYVLHVASGALLIYSPLQHCTPLRPSNEGGLSTRGRPSPFILIFYRWRKIKIHYTVGKIVPRHDAWFWSGLAVSCSVCLIHVSPKFCQKKKHWHSYIMVLCVCILVFCGHFFFNYQGVWRPYFFIKTYI